MAAAGTLIFLDTETTSLRPDRRVWEIGAVIRRPGGTEHRLHRFIRAEDLDLGNADPFSLDIGGYYTRHPACTGVVPKGAELHTEADALAELAHLARGALIAGNVVNFDTEVLAARCRANGLLWNAHYHLIDVEALAAGYLRGQAEAAENERNPELAARLRHAAEPPWDSEVLSAALGVDPAAYERHTALGDAQWAADMYDKTLPGRGQASPL